MSDPNLIVLGDRHDYVLHNTVSSMSCQQQAKDLQYSALFAWTESMHLSLFFLWFVTDKLIKAHQFWIGLYGKQMECAVTYIYMYVYVLEYILYYLQTTQGVHDMK